MKDIKNIISDEIGVAIAEKYNMVEEYWMSRNNGCDVIEALEEWDMIDDEILSLK